MRALVCACLAALSLGCPSQVEPGDPAKGEYGPKTDADDPRVVKVGDDLYAKDGKSNPEPEAPATSPGTGVPDESNGVCRLYAPQLPDPECCPFESGFDEAAAREICGLDSYLGESMRASCGFFFMRGTDTEALSFRIQPLMMEDAKQAADAEAMRLRAQLKRDFKVEPVPGVAGAYMIRHDVLRWAFIPGWKKVRQFAWMDKSCAPEKVPQLIKILAEAEQPAKTAERPLLPTARPAGEDGAKAPAVPAASGAN